MDGIAMLKHVFLCCHTTISSSKYEYFMYGHRIKHSLLHTTSFGVKQTDVPRLRQVSFSGTGVHLPAKVIQLLATHRFRMKVSLQAFFEYLYKTAFRR